MKRSRAHRSFRRSNLVAPTLAIAALAFGAVAGAAESVPKMYVADFLAASGRIVDVNEAGQVIGERDIDEGCDPFCVIVPSEPGVWTQDSFTALPVRPQWTIIILEGISADGWVTGTAYSSSDIRGIVWKPNGAGYDLLEIPNLPDTDFTETTGIDDSNRVIGLASRQFPATNKGFMWSEANGIEDLTDFGFPTDKPMAISPGGTVAYLYGWYQLDVPGLVHQNTGTPPGFGGPGAYFAINDTGDQIRLIGPSSGENIQYPFRYYNTGQWQQIWPNGGIDASPFGVGSITSNLDISLTISASGLVAPGPSMEAELLTPRLSPAYGDATVYEAGPLTENGQMAARLTIGKAPRPVRLVPAERCLSNCIRVDVVRLRSEFVEDPSNPGSCTGTAHTRSLARLRVTGENGAPLAGVEITGRFLTEYRLDGIVSGMSDTDGSIQFKYKSAPCTGAMTFLVTGAELPGWTFDRTIGRLQQWLIPQ